MKCSSKDPKYKPGDVVTIHSYTEVHRKIYELENGWNHCLEELHEGDTCLIIWAEPKEFSTGLSPTYVAYVITDVSQGFIVLDKNDEVTCET